MLNKIFPFLNWLPLTKKTWRYDIVSGLTSTVITIPQAIAFALIAGLPPVYGLYTAIVTPPIAALFGSSYQMITGSTTAISILIYATLSNFINPANNIEAYISLSIVLAFLVGFFQLIMGLLRMGKLVNFVSHSVIIGFTGGAGILIAFKQLKNVFGLAIPQGSPVFDIIKYLVSHIFEINWYVFTVAMATLLLALLIKYGIKPISRYHMLIAIIAGSFLAIYLGANQVGIKTVGDIPSHLPPFRLPDLSYSNIKKLSSGAFILALFGLVEAAAIGKSIALKTHQHINGNQEFIGQGLSNLIGSFFSCYTVSGSFTRSAVNMQAGAKTPLSAIIASAGLVVVLLVGTSYASYLPKAAMGAVIILAGYNLIDFHQIKQILKSSKRESVVLFITLIGTLFFDLEFALLAGIIASFFFYMERTSKPNVATMGLNKSGFFINLLRDTSAKECPQLKIVRIDGSIYFGAIETISNYFDKIDDKEDNKHLLIIADGINFIDLAGAEWLIHQVQRWRQKGGAIYFTGMKLISQDVIIKGGFYDKIGAENFFKDKNSAIKSIYKKLNATVCNSCKAKIFSECKNS